MKFLNSCMKMKKHTQEIRIIPICIYISPLLASMHSIQMCNALQLLKLCVCVCFSLYICVNTTRCRGVVCLTFCMRESDPSSKLADKWRFFMVFWLIFLLSNISNNDMMLLLQAECCDYTSYLLWNIVVRYAPALSLI